MGEKKQKGVLKTLGKKDIMPPTVRGKGEEEGGGGKRRRPDIFILREGENEYIVRLPTGVRVPNRKSRKEGKGTLYHTHHWG